jgi:Polyketide cyclase / dehydrase and lipid transport
MPDRTESSLVIDAAPGAVLDVIADFAAYPKWATEVKEATVLSEEGDGWPDRVEFVVDAGVIKDTYVLDYEWDVDDAGAGVVSWSLVKATVLRAMNGSYTLASNGPDSSTASAPSTHVTYRLAVDLTIPMLGMLKRKAEKVIVDTALRELKKRVEG